MQTFVTPALSFLPFKFGRLQASIFAIISKLNLTRAVKFLNSSDTPFEVVVSAMFIDCLQRQR